MVRQRDAQRAKHALLVLAGVRTTLSLLAFPLAPFLFRKHFLLLVLMRPSQVVLLIGAILARQGDVNLWAMIAAALPLQLFVVWLYFALGQRWQHDIGSDTKLPFVVSRLLHPEQIRRLRTVVRKRGLRFVALARFALFPTGLLAATAGASDVERREFFAVDGAALAVAMAFVIGLGYVLGFSQHQAEVWIAVGGVAGLLTLSGALTFYLWPR
ncbi:MAG TPA: VTT domain-containing protein [Acidimicrobiales bacterium]|nr:VTT domain-containing protein [Acidimicrobiales bacterium]